MKIKEKAFFFCNNRDQFGEYLLGTIKYRNSNTHSHLYGIEKVYFTEVSAWSVIEGWNNGGGVSWGDTDRKL
jgi:hypothetical protein